MRRKFILVTALILFFPVAVTAAGRSVNLHEALEIAMAQNHEIRAFGDFLSAKKEDVGIARSYLLPKITFEERFMRTTNPTYAFMAKLNQGRFAEQDFAVSSLNNPEAINDFQTSFSFEQLVFAKKAYIGLDMAAKEYGANNEEYIKKKQEIALKVVQTYLIVLTAKEYVAASEKALEDAREHHRIAQLRYDTGLGLYSDTLRASTAVTGAEQNLVSARKNLDVAKRALGLLLGLAEPVEPQVETFHIPLMAAEYYQNAAMQRRDILSLQARFENSKNGLRLADAGYYPVVGIGGSYQFNDHSTPFGTEGESWQLAAFLRWELFDGTRREHERAKAKYQIAETEEHLEGLKKVVSFKVYEAYLTVSEAAKNTELAQAALKTAEEGKRLVEERYKNSLSPLIDLLDAQVSLDHARADAIAKENDRRIALVNLGYESGTILKDLGIE
jgi:outer membrane protein